MVYVDQIVDHPLEAVQPAARRWGTKWCHMMADTLEELHTMAARIGMKRAWFQRDHYDLLPARRTVAIMRGAVQVDRIPIAVIRKYRPRHVS